MRASTVRRKLALWYSATVLLLLALFFAALFFTLTPAMVLRTNRLLQRSARAIAQEVGLESGYLHLDDIDLPLGIWFTVYDAHGDPALSNHPGGWLDELAWQEGPPYDALSGNHSYTVYDSYVYDGGNTIAALRVAVQADSLLEATRELTTLFWLLLPAIAAASLLVGTQIARHALRPVDAITETAREISQGDLSRRLGFPGTDDEVGRLAHTFDSMLDSMQAALEREKRFTADASHELRTPLSVILARAQEVLGHPSTTPDEYRAAVQAIEKKGRELQAMLSQLLLLSRSFEQAQDMDLALLDLGDIAQDIAGEMEGAAKERHMELHAATEAGCLVRGDLLLLTRMVMNLLDNAIQYGNDGGCIRLQVCREGDEARISVADDGPGIAPDKLPHIFERFYRADPARSSRGSGLGLSLVEWVAHLHRGSVEARSEQGAGSVFTVRLPTVTNGGDSQQT